MHLRTSTYSGRGDTVGACRGWVCGWGWADTLEPSARTIQAHRFTDRTVAGFEYAFIIVGWHVPVTLL